MKSLRKIHSKHYNWPYSEYRKAVKSGDKEAEFDALEKVKASSKDVAGAVSQIAEAFVGLGEAMSEENSELKEITQGVLFLANALATIASSGWIGVIVVAVNAVTAIVQAFSSSAALTAC